MSNITVTPSKRISKEDGIKPPASHETSLQPDRIFSKMGDGQPSGGNITFNEKYYDMIPRPTQDEWHALEHSIQLHGLREPVVVNQDGVLLDGYTRYEICQNRKIPIQTRTKSFDSKEDELRYVLEVNATRRQLNAFQRVELFHDIFRSYQRQAADNHKNSNRPGDRNFPTGGSLIRYSELVGVGQKRTHAALKIIESDNECLKIQCRNGTMTVNEAYHLLDDTKVRPGPKKSGGDPAIKTLMKFFDGRPEKIQLENILKIYQEAHS